MTRRSGDEGSCAPATVAHNAATEFDVRCSARGVVGFQTIPRVRKACPGERLAGLAVDERADRSFCGESDPCKNRFAAASAPKWSSKWSI